MRFPPLPTTIFLWALSLLILVPLQSCNKNKSLHAFEGYVYNKNKEPVVDARVQIFKSPQDWLTGHNMVVSMTTTPNGNFFSSKIYEAGDYYIFVEKYDTSNWDIRNVEKGIYPKITLPSNGDINQTIEPNNMSLLANTRWILSNILIEYIEPGHTAVEWHSQWSVSNNCVKDNKLFFGKDLSLRINEGDVVCSNKKKNVLASFVPPMIFTSFSCDKLLHTSQNVKEFEVYDWPEMENLNAKMFLACDQSIGQLYIIHDAKGNKKTLEVYKRF